MINVEILENTSTKEKAEGRTARCENAVDDRREAKRSMEACLSGNRLSDRLDSPPPMPPKLLALKTPLHPPNTPPFPLFPHQQPRQLYNTAFVQEMSCFYVLLVILTKTKTVLSQSLLLTSNVFLGLLSHDPVHVRWIWARVPSKGNHCK